MVCFKPLTGLTFCNAVQGQGFGGYAPSPCFKPLTGLTFCNEEVREEVQKSVDQSFKPLTGLTFCNPRTGPSSSSWGPTSFKPLTGLTFCNGFHDPLEITPLRVSNPLRG